jgi:NADH:ubiquinone oxidoreductase subunit F (NADH-binding)/(2Fe-2S) ferredoxin/NAD-dependent dihydropyrimidine dehydrogenase PreA subunit
MRKIEMNELEQIAAEQTKTLNGYKSMLMVCTGTGCVAAKGFELKDELTGALKEAGMDKDHVVIGTGCNGFCAVGPIVVVQPHGTFYQKVKAADIPELVEHIAAGTIMESLLHTDPVSGVVAEKMNDIKFFSKQQLVALRNKGLIDPENIDHYIARDGYQGLKKVLQQNDPEAVIQEVIASGIRGRGGAGFPAGVKWESGRKARVARDEEIYILCNADEGDPGAFMDRSIIETDPHSVIEGMLIAAFATGSKEGHIYIRKEYPLACTRLKKAIEDARNYGLLGDGILATDFCFDLHIHRGAGAFVCGESSALMTSMEGKVGEPRAKYVRSVEYGFRNKPSILNNVETWANIPVIMDKGASWFAGIGTGDVNGNPWGGSSGTKVFSLVGDIRNTGLVEVAMGTTIREIVDDIGGGIPNGRQFKAVQTGGPSGGCLPAEMLDMKVDFDSLTEAGSMMGSGGMIVMDDKKCMVDVARYFTHFLANESCGKCTSCREGLYAMDAVLTRICSGDGRPDDIEFMEDIAETLTEASMCQLGATAANPVLSTIRLFREEYDQHINEGRCAAGVCKPLIEYSIDADVCNGCTVCAKRCPVDAIEGELKGVHVIDTEVCIKCGICYEVCKPGAVEVK